MDQQLGNNDVNTPYDPTLDLHFVDLRSDEERQIEREAYTGVTLGPDVDPLLEELMEIGRICDFVSDSGGDFNEHGQHIRTREIGVTLNRIGGMELMQAVYYRILAVLGLTRARSLEFAWGHIGHWLP